MAKTSISSYLRDHLDDIGNKQEPGPYLTISRQYGCDGYELGELLVENLSERDAVHPWKLYFKESLKQLADDTGLTEEILEKERLAKPSMFSDFLRGLKKSRIPDGYEIRKNITLMVRMVAHEGYCVIIGQGGAAATAGINNGLSVRIEAPKDWRVARISVRDKIDKTKAVAKIDEMEQQRKYLRKIYEEMNPREPAFALTLDNSIFTKNQLAEMIILCMEQKGLIEKGDEKG